MWTLARRNYPRYPTDWDETDRLRNWRTTTPADQPPEMTDETSTADGPPTATETATDTAADGGDKTVESVDAHDSSAGVAYTPCQTHGVLYETDQPICPVCHAEAELADLRARIDSLDTKLTALADAMEDE